MKGIEKLDVTALIADPRNVLLACEGGAALFCWKGPALYEITDVWKPQFIGAYSNAALLQAICWMFTHIDCAAILATVPCVRLIAKDPLIVDTGAAVLQITDDRSYKILKTR